jgi:hypothetical protein
MVCKFVFEKTPLTTERPLLGFALVVLPYAAILIFGTKLIPEQPATAAPKSPATA